MKVIGFMGLAQSGKTTGAQTIGELLNQSEEAWVYESFAGPLKQGLEVMGITKAKTPDLYRSAAQYIGTDIVRKQDPNWWCNLYQKTLSWYIEHEFASLVLTDDVRFPNEAQVVNECNGALIFVYTGDRLNLDQPMYLHESESMALELHTIVSTLKVDWDTIPYITIKAGDNIPIFVLNNTRTLEHYQQVLKDFYDNYNEPVYFSEGITDIRIDGDDEGMVC